MGNKQYSIVGKFIGKNSRSFRMGRNFAGWGLKGINNLHNYPFLKTNNPKNFHSDEPAFTTVTTLNSKQTPKARKR